MDDDDRARKLADFTLEQVVLISAIANALDQAWRAGVTKEEVAEAIEWHLQSLDFLAVIQPQNLLE